MKTFESILDDAHETARQELLYFLSKCSKRSVLKFKRIFANGNSDLPIRDLVYNIPVEKLDGAMRIVDAHLKKKYK